MIELFNEKQVKVIKDNLLEEVSLSKIFTVSFLNLELCDKYVFSVGGTLGTLFLTSYLIEDVKRDRIKQTPKGLFEHGVPESEYDEIGGFCVVPNSFYKYTGLNEIYYASHTTLYVSKTFDSFDIDLKKLIS